MLVVLFGVLSVVDLPIQLTPDIATPTISVSTVWPGAAPVEIETEILEPQEEVLKNVQGLTRMESSASMNSGRITLEFEVDTVIEEALVRVTNKLSQVASYPDSVREPVVETANSAGPPLAVIAIRDPKKGSVAAYRLGSRTKFCLKSIASPAWRASFSSAARTPRSMCCSTRRRSQPAVFRCKGWPTGCEASSVICPEAT